jgi:hypothetical protein
MTSESRENAEAKKGFLDNCPTLTLLWYSFISPKLGKPVGRENEQKVLEE